MGKIYLYYMKQDTSLYAYTENQNYDKRFQVERNMENFYRVVKKSRDYDENALKSFRSTCRRNQLIEIPVRDRKGNNITIIGTYQEDELLSAAVEELQVQIDSIKASIVDDLYYEQEYFNLKFVADIESFLEYVDVMDDKTECVYFPVAFDTFHLFVFLFHRTFYMEEVWEGTEEFDDEKSILNENILSRLH